MLMISVFPTVIKHPKKHSSVKNAISYDNISQANIDLPSPRLQVPTKIELQLQIEKKSL